MIAISARLGLGRVGLISAEGVVVAVGIVTWVLAARRPYVYDSRFFADFTLRCELLLAM
jgi:hypothetical protein